MKDKVKAIFEALKKLDIMATPGNVSIMTGVYTRLKEIYAELESKEGDDGGEHAEADPE